MSWLGGWVGNWLGGWLGAVTVVTVPVVPGGGDVVPLNLKRAPDADAQADDDEEVMTVVIHAFTQVTQ